LQTQFLFRLRPYFTSLGWSPLQTVILNRHSENACGFLRKLFKMILEIAAVLFLVYILRMLSRLLARRCDVSYDVSKSVHGSRRASRWADAAKAQYPAALLSFAARLPDEGLSRYFGREDLPLSLSIRTDRQKRGVGASERVCPDGVKSMSRKPLGLHQHERSAGRMFRPRKRPSLGLQITASPTAR
jgi:hypothetical protein